MLPQTKKYPEMRFAWHKMRLLADKTSKKKEDKKKKYRGLINIQELVDEDTYPNIIIKRFKLNK